MRVEHILPPPASSSATTSLALFTQGARLLAEADTLQKAKELKSLALTAADWARRKGMGEEAIRYCRSYALEAERRMGEMLLTAEKNTGAKGVGPIAVPSGNRNAIPTLAALGLSKKESVNAQQLAALPRETFEEVRDGKKTRTEVKREIKRAAVIKRVATLPSGKFRVFYADPPWKYGDTLAGELSDSYGGAEKHYPSMSIAELCALPIKELAEDDAVLFLWVTSPMLEEAFPVIKTWGFDYRTNFVWDKVKHNMGHYNSVRHELLYVCVRGSCTPDVKKLFDSVQQVERTAKHSEKPEVFREIIDTIYPHGRRVELFARRKVKNWEVYGNEC